LSVAGKGRGMTKGSGTRSGLLWEVERLLNEVENLPQVLLMENVPQVHGAKNMNDFQSWIDFLESKGYTNFWQDLNAKNYGVAQNRNRTFMVSILGRAKFKFPEPIELKYIMKDYLEDSVEEKYYVTSPKALELIDRLKEEGTLKNL
jgi:DNA (cytosine-5)-methyltransferase 1